MWKYDALSWLLFGNRRAGRAKPSTVYVMRSRICKSASAQRRHWGFCTLKGVNRYERKPDFASKKYSRIIECFAKQRGISLDVALDFFYHSEVYQLIRDGVSDMHCMSDAYLAEELEQEYGQKE